ncbi:SLATT domain-containing protein [Stenotrophomonas maltophilia]|uniref:SLATT domain-containing protein n=1 Tax=Stenotrophomonas maltophilia TaxID=40324 RepID=UPI0021C87F89|nr:SLATT domain-containing protein [Stenotrophomonas maltophilia]MCU1014739.1 SLATT domain-containing protein [Stenotrophomonas maltophilia]MDH1129056.1 SLATT domain-containing protein [Stenotrophomonas maltophilia]HDS1132010.1 SLATT domain-containing protein [Stenotrophomonas maltophilia]HEL7888855.1 SLATT domain-containing protein [Stenotrophomonas maltophilia]
MNRDQLLKEVATTGYNVLYSAKKHFATFDIVEKVPGWLTISTIAVGIFGLIIPALTNNYLSAAILVIGVASIYFNQFQDGREKYAKAGGKLVSNFNVLRGIYHDAKSRGPSDNVDDLESRYREALKEAEQDWLHKHIFISDWYAHYKIFWQAQIDWLDEQLHFKFWRDKIPLTLSITVALTLILGLSLVTIKIIKMFAGCA